MAIIGEITGKGDCIGGIVGSLNCGEITGCYNKGNITCDENDDSCNVGGICGNSCIYSYTGSEPQNIIQYSYNTGTITSRFVVGGIAGYPSGFTNIEKCYNKGSISESNDDNIGYGGIAGILNANIYINGKPNAQQKAISQMSYSCNIGPVSSNGTQIGGICGNNAQYCIVKDNYILQGLAIQKGSTIATRDIGTSSAYLGKYVGRAYSTSTNYISGNGEITNTITTENGKEDITDTVYYIVNGCNEGESEYWAKDDVTQPSLKWELQVNN